MTAGRCGCWSIGRPIGAARADPETPVLEQDGRANPGARLAGVVACLIVALYAVRAFGNLLGLDFSFMRSSLPQGALTLALIFLSMSLNFGFLLMAIDRLRNEVADLALLDDLTGVGNRRQLDSASPRNAPGRTAAASRLRCW